MGNMPAKNDIAVERLDTSKPKEKTPFRYYDGDHKGVAENTASEAHW